MRHIAFATSLICGLLAHSDAFGQGFWYVPPETENYNYSYGYDLGNGIGYGVGYGFGYGLASSPEAVAASAYNDLVRFQSQCDPGQPQSASNRGEVDRDRTATLQKQKSAEEFKKQSEQRIQQAKAEKVGRARYLEFQANAPKAVPMRRLTTTEFDNTTGQIQWPSALLRDSFAVERAEIESLLKSRVQVGTTDGLDADILRKTLELSQELRDQIRAIPAKEYLEGRKFLNRLAFEAQLPVS